MEGFTTTDGVADKTVTMNVNDSYTLTTSGKPSAVTWGLTDTSSANVTNGVFSASKEGDYVVYATLAQSQFVGDSPELVSLMGKQTIQITIHVIDSFGISEDKHTLYVGDSFVLKAVTTDPDTPVTFTYKNLPPVTGGDVPKDKLVSLTDYKEEGSNVVTGTTIKGLKAGIVEITATQVVNNVTKTATCIVYVIDKPIEVTSLAIDPSSIQIDKGSNAILNVVFNKNASTPENMNVFWSSSDTDIVTVEGNGNLHTATITGKKCGTAVVMVVSQDGLYSATCTVSVREPVTGVTLNETSITASLSQKQFQLVPTVLPAGDGVNRNVTWSSTDPSVLTVDKNGLVTYKGTGYASVICTTDDGGYQAFCNFYVNIPVESLKLDYTDEIMSIGSTLRITAEVLPVTATNRTVVWESSNTNVCIVDSNGLVEAVGTGSCTILCKSLDGNYTAMCNIYVKQPVTQVILNTTDITVRQGQVFWLNATCLPENADNKIISWESRDESVCTVESDGKVTAVGAGTTSIIATNVDTGLTAYCVVTVTQPVTGISLNSDYQELWVGAKYAIIPVVEPYDAENKNVTYLSSDPSVATVDENGVVTALKGGSCIIEVTTEVNKLTAACTIVVKEYVSSITLSETDKFMNVGSTGTLVASVGTDTATNKNIVWSSSNYDICYVDGNGNLSANSVGNAVITATAADGSGVSASCIVKVVDPVIGITVEPDTVRLLVGDSAKVTAVITPDSATVKDVSWTSSNEAIATVDESGEIFALSTGKCKITATSQDGNEVKGVCWVYVTPVVNISSLRINSKEIYMLSGRARQLSVIVRPVNNTDSYEWYSTDTGIVQVDQNGVITTVGPGTADVFVISNNSSVEASCTVHSLAVSTSRVRLEQYDRFNLDVIGTEDAVTWRSSNPRVCTVSSSGEVIGRRAGTATVTATVHNKTLSCTVTVTNIR